MQVHPSARITLPSTPLGITDEAWSFALRSCQRRPKTDPPARGEDAGRSRQSGARLIARTRLERAGERPSRREPRSPTTPWMEASGRTVLACPTPAACRSPNQAGTGTGHVRQPDRRVDRLRWLRSLPPAACRHAKASTVPRVQGQTARPGNRKGQEPARAAQRGSGTRSMPAFRSAMSVLVTLVRSSTNSSGALQAAAARPPSAAEPRTAGGPASQRLPAA
jgi:hypothetical protein